MNSSKVFFGVALILMQAALWIFLSPSGQSIFQRFPIILLLPITGLGLLFVISGSEPPSINVK